jgi:hypothetical protein
MPLAQKKVPRIWMVYKWIGIINGKRESQTYEPIDHSADKRMDDQKSHKKTWFFIYS